MVHESREDYSTWLLPAVRECLAGSGLKMEGVEALRSGGWAGLVYWRTGWIDGRESLGGGVTVRRSRRSHVWKPWPPKPPTGRVGLRHLRAPKRGQVFGAVYQRKGRAIGAPGRWKWGLRRVSFLEAAEERRRAERIRGCLRMRSALWRRGMESAGAARRTNRERVNRAGADDRMARTGST